MKLYYYKSPEGNFGDDLNAWLWDELMPKQFDESGDVCFSGIGTIINTSMPESKKWIVFGSGVGYGYPPEGFGNPSWDIKFVRGPLSAKVLGLPQDNFITDAAILLKQLPEFNPLNESEREGTIFVPHHHALLTGKWKRACELAGIEFVDPTSDAREVISKIRKSKLVIADAMHAAIIADALRVSWVPVTTSNQINTFKWCDWAYSLEMEYKPTQLGSSSFREFFRNIFLGLYGEKYYSEDTDAKTLAEKFYKQRNLKSSSWWPLYSKYIRRIVFGVPDKILCYLDDKNLLPLNNYFINKAARNLKNASKSPAYLSCEEVHQKKLNLVIEKVEEVKQAK